MSPPPPPQLDTFRYGAACSNNRDSRESLLGSYLREEDEYDEEAAAADEPWRRGCQWFCCCGWIAAIWAKASDAAVELWEFAKSDRRKVIFAAKMGFALGLVSVLIYFKEPTKDLSKYAIWAVLTVVVVFEFSIGATLSKGLNRALGTLCAGALVLGVAALSTLAGDWEELAIIISVFLVGSLTTFIKLHPKMKPYEYGFRVFVITFCFVMVSGYNTRVYLKTVVSRFLLIALGAAVGFGVNICIYPIWAGEDLHNLVVKNFMGVADSLEGCVDGYLRCVAYERVPSKILTYQASDDPVYSGYRTAVQSTSQEDTLLGFAIWEPPHGPYKMLKYPWKNYVEVSGALRHCAFMVMALHGCILAEIQAPPEKRLVFKKELQRVGAEGAKVLRELGNKVKTMTKLNSTSILIEVHEAAEELQKKIDRRSYLLVNSESWEIGKRPEKEALDHINKEKEKERMRTKSLSETLLNLRSIDFSKTQDVKNNGNVKFDTSTTRVEPTEDPIFSKIGKRPEKEALDHINKEKEKERMRTKSLSETLLNLRSIDFSKTQDVTNNGNIKFDTSTTRVEPTEDPIFSKQVSWPARRSFVIDEVPTEEDDLGTYESASALSLATFASLLIEFVARLQYLVDEFQELSEKANFKDPVNETIIQNSFWTKVTKCLF